MDYKTKMKKFLILALILILSTELYACKKEQTKNNSDGITQQTNINPNVSDLSQPAKPQSSSGVIIKHTTLYQEKSLSSESIIELEKGNLIRVLSLEKVGMVTWCKVELPAFSYPPLVGYIEATDYTADKTKVVPNQGFVARDDVNVHTEANTTSKVVNKEQFPTPLQIIKRQNGWAYCHFPAGANEGWIKESDIQYEFPN